MSACASCGLAALAPGVELCSHHTILVTDWATANRIWCNGLHRGDWPPRLAQSDRVDLDDWSSLPSYAGDAA